MEVQGSGHVYNNEQYTPWITLMYVGAYASLLASLREYADHEPWLFIVGLTAEEEAAVIRYCRAAVPTEEGGRTVVAAVRRIMGDL